MLGRDRRYGVRLRFRFRGVARQVVAELVIFDCDGVLIDSERLSVKVDVVVLRKLGWPLSEAEVIERFVGRSDRDTQDAIEAHLGRRLPNGGEEQFKPLYDEAFEAELGPGEGVVDALDRITVPTCVASSGTHEYLRHMLGLTGLYDRFAGRIFSADDVATGNQDARLGVLSAATAPAMRRLTSSTARAAESIDTDGVRTAHATRFRRASVIHAWKTMRPASR